VTAVQGYAGYVKQNTADLVSHTQTFCKAIDAGNMNQAKVLYPQARVYYEQIEPVAEVWGSLDTSIDGRWENPVTVKSQFTGSHRLEQMLWQDNNSLNGAPAMGVVSGTSRADLRDLLRVWTSAAARMAAGQQVGEETDPNAPPVDTGEAVGSPVSRLTVTIGYGPALFDDRFGLAARKPAALTDLPPLPNENLDPDYTGGDPCVQACADNPLVAFHAVRNLARIGMGVVTHNWMELGFGRTSTTSTAQATPRNLLGFKDGTRNIKAEQTELLNEHVWVGQETDQPWLRGGSYMVTRKIRMFVENWDRDYLRRGYSFTDGIDPQAGTLLGGLFFIAFMKNPSQFVKLQTALAGDALNEYIHHTGSATFAVPPGLRPGQHYGDALFS
jgi:deferrochelatase/peroxidase EfeB